MAAPRIDGPFPDDPVSRKEFFRLEAERQRLKEQEPINEARRVCDAFYRTLRKENPWVEQKAWYRLPNVENIFPRARHLITVELTNQGFEARITTDNGVEVLNPSVQQ